MSLTSTNGSVVMCCHDLLKWTLAASFFWVESEAKMWMSVIFINEGCEALTYCFHISIVSLLFSVIIMTYLCSLNCSSTIEIDWFAWTGPENCWWFNGKIMNCMMPLSFPKSTFQPYTFSTCFIRHSGWKGNIDWFSYFSCRLVICFVILLARLVNMLSTMMPYCWLLCLLVRRLKFLPLELWRPRRSMIQTVSTLNFSSSRPLHYIFEVLRLPLLYLD